MNSELDDMKQTENKRRSIIKNIGNRGIRGSRRQKTDRVLYHQINDPA